MTANLTNGLTSVFRLSPLIRITLLSLYLALTVPLPFLAQLTAATIPAHLKPQLTKHSFHQLSRPTAHQQQLIAQHLPTAAYSTTYSTTSTLTCYSFIR